MKRKTPQLTVGSFCLIRQPRPAKYQVPGDPASMFFPVWKVKLHFPGKPDWMRSSEVAICAACLAVPASERVTKVRPDCKCRAGAVLRAEGWLAEERKAYWERVKSPRELEIELRDALRWKDVKPLWMANAPVASREATWNRLRLMIEQATGLPMDEQPVSELTWPLFLNWAQMRQEFSRRWPDGAPKLVPWSVPALHKELEGKKAHEQMMEAVNDPWTVLRAELKAGLLPALVTSRVMAVNTTIKGYLRAARNVVGPKSRSVYLRGLKAELPPMKSFLLGRIDLPSPIGHVEIPPEVYAKMYAAAEALKVEDEQLWLVNQLLWRFGLRPIEVWLARANWVEMDGEVPVLVLKNRGDEYVYESGYKKGQASELKARHRAIVRRYKIPADVWAAMQRVMVPEGSLLGTPTTAAAQALVEKEHSAWMRLWMPETTHSSYLLRHFLAAYTTARWGALAASLFMGHSTSEVRASVTQSRYAGGGGTKVLPAIEWADLAPDAKYVRRMRGEFEAEALFQDA